MLDFGDVAHYLYHTGAMIKCMEKHLEEFHFYKDVFSPFSSSKSTKKLSESVKQR
jgi:hypothetical protein